MKFLKNQSIFGKIVSILLLIIVLNVVISLVGVHFLQNMNISLTGKMGTQTANIKLASSINWNLLEIHRAEKSMLLSVSREDIDFYSKKISECKAELEGNLDHLFQLSDDKEVTALLLQFNEDYRKFIQINNNIKSIINREAATLPAGSEKSTVSAQVSFLNIEAVALSSGAGRAAYYRAAQSMQILVDAIDTGLSVVKASGDQNVNKALTIMVVLLLVCIIIELILGFLASCSIYNRLNNIAAAAFAFTENRLL